MIKGPALPLADSWLPDAETGTTAMASMAGSGASIPSALPLADPIGLHAAIEAPCQSKSPD
jgi:hypothetical protein